MRCTGSAAPGRHTLLLLQGLAMQWGTAMDSDDNGGNNTRCEWVLVTGAMCWVLDTGLSISLFRVLCFFHFLSTPISAQHIYFIRCLFFCIFTLGGWTTTEHPHSITPNRQQIATLATFIRVNELSIWSGVASAALSSCCVCCNFPVPCSCLANTRSFCYFFYVPVDLWKLSNRGKPTLCKRM